MDILDHECTDHVFKFLTGAERAVMCCVVRYWRDIFQSDNYWRQSIIQEYRHVDTLTICGVQFPTYRAMYIHLATSSKLYPGLFKRSLEMWGKIEAWLRDNFPEVLGSLLPGATEEQLNETEEQLGHPLPAALRAIYRVRNGQDSAFDRSIDDHMLAVSDLSAEINVDDPSLAQGLFGGYQVYHILAFTRLLPVSRMAQLTRFLRWGRVMRLFPDPKPMAFAAHFQFDKIMMVKVQDASVWGNTDTPCHPPDPVPGSNDGVLRWMEQYADRLAAEMYRVAELQFPNVPRHRYISLFAQKAPEAVTAVTRGIRVQASTVRITNSSMQSYAYSIRMSMLSLEEQQQGWPEGTPFRPLQSAQLLSRHWYITDGGNVDEVEGPGVIGEFPLLLPGGPEFVYQSQTSMKCAEGYMEGTFTFVEGSQAHPTGGEFRVVCPRFYLRRPDYIY